LIFVLVFVSRDFELGRNVSCEELTVVPYGANLSEVQHSVCVYNGWSYTVQIWCANWLLWLSSVLWHYCRVTRSACSLQNTALIIIKGSHVCGIQS